MVEKISTSWISIVSVLLLCIFVRLYGFTNPIADWHSWRQVDTSSVSRTFVDEGFDLLHPKYHDLSNVPSGKDNPEGYRFVEFPLFNASQALLFTSFSFLRLEQWGRVLSIGASVLSTLFLYLLVRKFHSATAGIFTALFYAVLPFSIYYGRTILPDPSMVSAVLGAIYFFSLWTDDNFSVHFADWRKTLIVFLALVFAIVALLFKPYALFFMLPMAVIAFQQVGIAFLRKWQLWLFAFLAILPLILWRLWMQQYPEGIPANNWLFNEGNIRFKGAFFYWLFADRIGRLILGYWGIALFILGILAVSKKQNLFFFSFLASSLLYLTVIARGNVQHDYYQIAIIPSIALFLGLGSAFLLNPPKEFNKSISYLLFAICSAFTLMFGWYHIRDYYNINNPSIMEAGRIVDEKTPKNAKVIAIYNGDTTFLYQTKRKGWASFQKPIEEMVTLGAEYLVFVNPNQQEIQYFGERYPIVASSSAYLLLQLK